MMDQFSPAERQVAEWLLQHRFDAARMKLAAVAEAAAVSEPTVVRFCRRIGCSGYSDFRLRWAASRGQTSETVHAVVNASDTAATVLRKVFDTGITELQRVRNGLNADHLENAAASLSEATRILFAGVGASAVVALDATNKFFRLGLACTALTDEPTILQAAATCAPRQVLFLISKGGQGEALQQAMAAAAACGATTMALTAPGSPLAASARYTLPVDTTEDTAIYTPMSSRLAQLTVLDVLQVCTAMAGGEQARRHLEASKSILKHDLR